MAHPVLARAAQRASAVFFCAARDCWSPKSDQPFFGYCVRSFRYTASASAGRFAWSSTAPSA